MKKYPVALGVLLIFWLGLFAQESPKKWDLCLMGGLGFASVVGGSQFSRTWTFDYLAPINETTAITPAGKNGFALTANFSYYFSSNFGVQVGAGLLTRRNTIASDWTLDWHWTDTDETFNDGGSFPGTRSRLDTVPVFANIIGRYRMGVFELFGSAGPTIYFNSFKADAFSIYADSYYNTYVGMGAGFRCLPGPTPRRHVLGRLRFQRRSGAEHPRFSRGSVHDRGSLFRLSRQGFEMGLDDRHLQRKLRGLE